MKFLLFLPVLAMGWCAQAPASTGQPAPDLSEYVYLHATRNEAAVRAQSCRGKIQARYISHSR